ncbi:hypothetical protein ADUPG1_000560, partial [Aduncisulcus paluster]
EYQPLFGFHLTVSIAPLNYDYAGYIAIEEFKIELDSSVLEKIETFLNLRNDSRISYLLSIASSSVSTDIMEDSLQNRIERFENYTEEVLTRSDEYVSQIESMMYCNTIFTTTDAFSEASFIMPPYVIHGYGFRPNILTDLLGATNLISVSSPTFFDSQDERENEMDGFIYPFISSDPNFLSYPLTAYEEIDGDIFLFSHDWFAFIIDNASEIEVSISVLERDENQWKYDDNIQCMVMSSDDIISCESIAVHTGDIVFLSSSFSPYLRRILIFEGSNEDINVVLYGLDEWNPLNEANFTGTDWINEKLSQFKYKLISSYESFLLGNFQGSTPFELFSISQCSTCNVYIPNSFEAFNSSLLPLWPYECNSDAFLPVYDTSIDAPLLSQDQKQVSCRIPKRSEDESPPNELYSRFGLTFENTSYAYIPYKIEGNFDDGTYCIFFERGDIASENSFAALDPSIVCEWGESSELLSIWEKSIDSFEEFSSIVSQLSPVSSYITDMNICCQLDSLKKEPNDLIVIGGFGEMIPSFVTKLSIPVPLQTPTIAIYLDKRIIVIENYISYLKYFWTKEEKNILQLECSAVVDDIPFTIISSLRLCSAGLCASYDDSYELFFGSEKEVFCRIIANQISFGSKMSFSSSYSSKIFVDSALWDYSQASFSTTRSSILSAAISSSISEQLSSAYSFDDVVLSPSLRALLNLDAPFDEISVDSILPFGHSISICLEDTNIFDVSVFWSLDSKESYSYQVIPQVNDNCISFLTPSLPIMREIGDKFEKGGSFWNINVEGTSINEGKLVSFSSSASALIVPIEFVDITATLGISRKRNIDGNEDIFISTNSPVKILIQPIRELLTTTIKTLMNECVSSLNSTFTFQEIENFDEVFLLQESTAISLEKEDTFDNLIVCTAPANAVYIDGFTDPILFISSRTISLVTEAPITPTLEEDDSSDEEEEEVPLFVENNTTKGMYCTTLGSNLLLLGILFIGVIVIGKLTIDTI